MTLTMIANVLTITIVRHGDMLPNIIKNCYFAPGNLTGENGFFRVLNTNKKLSGTCGDRRSPTTHVQLGFKAYPREQKSLRIPDTLIAGIQF